MIDSDLARVLQITACKMFMTDREQFRTFTEKGYSGHVATEWKSFYIAARARGLLFNAQVEARTPYRVNFLLGERELERVEEFMQMVSEYDGGWESREELIPRELHEALLDFRSMTLN